MCGIVGYIGEKSAQHVLLNGLRRLEYRGYDSAGIAVYDSGTGGVRVEKRRGRVQDLAARLGDDPLSGTCGIAHTRWATHGEPTDANAHPHASEDGSVVIVHNGTIENHAKLREELLNAGVHLRSETDSELFAHLIAREFAACGDPMKAIRNALRHVQGAYGLVVLFRAFPQALYVARLGSPIVVGVGEREMIVASAEAAILQCTRDIFTLNEGEIAELRRASYDVRTFKDEKCAKVVERTELTEEQAQKAPYKHFMLKEIMEQPGAIQDTIRGRLDEESGLAILGGLREADERLRGIERILIVACGTAYHAGLVGKYLFEVLARIPVEVEVASEFRYRETPLHPKTAILAVSQSGETADTIQAIHEAKRQGLLTLGIVNVPGSAIARETDAGVYTRAGLEIGVASTKAFTTQLVALALCAVYLGRQRGMMLVQGAEIVRELMRMPYLVRETLSRRDAYRRIAERLVTAKHALFIGRKWSCPIAYEGALKLKEISYIHAEGYAAGEMKHGPLALIDSTFPTVAVVPDDRTSVKTLSNISEIRARSGPVYAVTTDGNTSVAPCVNEAVFVPKTIEPLTPILTTIPLQLIAYETATLLGLDPDMPRNLAKSVTVE
jgi:glucosamine--fructose-6-phosphate aminotransferase (isomerizing)